jgi:hypothetical protein
VVGERPEHVHAVPQPELYVELPLSSRPLAGRGIGARLISHAAVLARDGTFDVKGWQGQVFSMRL